MCLVSMAVILLNIYHSLPEHTWVVEAIVHDCSLHLLDAVAMCLPDDVTMFQKAFSQILHWGHQGNVKEQVCGVVRLLSSTILHIHTVFCDSRTSECADSGRFC